MHAAGAGAAAAAPDSRPAAWSSALVPRLLAGTAILLAWELVVRGYAPAYVAKPTGVLASVPKVLANPAFQQATVSTLTAVAQGLVIAIVLGTLVGIVIGRSIVADRMLRHYVNGFYAV